MSRDDFYDSLFGRAYSAYIERPRLNRLIARVAWGGDTKPYYESMGAVAEVPAGGTVVDCPCGSGPVFRMLPTGSDIDYVAADLSPAMLARARARAEKRGLREIRFVETDATAIPWPTARRVSSSPYWDLHCFPEPHAAIEETARVLRPGGRLVGCCFVRGDSLRQRLQLRPTRLTSVLCARSRNCSSGSPRPGDVRSRRSGLFLFFDALREDAGEPSDRRP